MSLAMGPNRFGLSCGAAVSLCFFPGHPLDYPRTSLVGRGLKGMRSLLAVPSSGWLADLLPLDGPGEEAGIFVATASTRVGLADAPCRKRTLNPSSPAIWTIPKFSGASTP